MRRIEQSADGAARDRLHSLVATPSRAAPPPDGATSVRGAEPGWVPASPAAPETADADVRAVVARMRTGALTSAAATYTAAHGHPLEHGRRGGGPARRWRLSVRLAAVAGTAIAVLGAGVAARATLGTPAIVMPADANSAVAIPVGPSLDPQATGTGSGATDLVVVHVVGQVAAPGLVQLRPGARVSDAVAAAGGATSGADLAAVNLARVVGDGEQLVIPAPGEEVPGALGAGLAASGAPGGATPLVDLNSADLASLDGLPGIGPVLAQRVLDWRAANGRFTDVEELGEIAGIGETLLGRLRALVRV